MLHWVTSIGVRGGGSWGAAAPLSWIISGQTLFSGQAQDAQKSWMIKNILIQWKIWERLVFSTASASCSKILNDKKYFNIVQIFRATLFFRASASSSKILNVKIYSLYWKISGQTLFLGQAQAAQKSWTVKNVFNAVENSTANSDFQGKVKKISIRYIQPVKTITVKFFVCENTARKELHPLELTSKPSTEFAYNGTSGECIKNVIADLKL